MALSLTRREGQAIIINGPSVVRVVKVKSSKENGKGNVTLQITADKDVAIHREEAINKQRPPAKTKETT